MSAGNSKGNQNTERIQRSSKLLEYLRKAVVDAEKGDAGKLAKCLPEVTSKSQKADLFEHWMEAYTELLGESARARIGGGGAAETLINEIVLRKIPWFEANTTANGRFDLFEKYALKLLSLNPATHLTTIYRLLFTHLLRGEDQELLRERKPEIKVGGQVFTDRITLINHVYGILNSSHYSQGNVEKTRVNEADSTFLMSFFRFHPRGAAKLAGTDSVWIGPLERDDVRTRCFFLRRRDGTFEDISYLKTADFCVSLHTDASVLQLISEERNRFIDRVVAFLERALRIYPLSKAYVVSLIAELFPYKAESTSYHLYFYTLVLKLVNSDHRLQLPLLRLYVERLLAIDNEIKATRAIRIYDEEGIREESMDFENDEMLRKFDLLLSLLLEFLQFRLGVAEESRTHNLFGKNMKTKPEVAEVLLYEILDIIQHVILQAEHVNGLQYLVLFVASLYRRYTELVEKLLSLLVQNLHDEDCAPWVRLNSCRLLIGVLVRCEDIPKGDRRRAFRFVFSFAKGQAAAMTETKGDAKDYEKAVRQQHLLLNLNAELIWAIHNLSEAEIAARLTRNLGNLLSKIVDRTGLNLLAVFSYSYLKRQIEEGQAVTEPLSELIDAALSIVQSHAEKLETTFSFDSKLFHPFDQAPPSLTEKCLKSVSGQQQRYEDILVGARPVEDQTNSSNLQSVFVSPMHRGPGDEPCARSNTETEATDNRLSLNKKKKRKAAKQINEDQPRKQVKFD